MSKTAACNNWYVLTGGPSSGKTSLINELAKVGHAVIPEAARTYFDEQLAKGLSIEKIRADEQRCQEEIAKLKMQIESVHPKDTLTFFDRGMHDTLAYMRHYGFEFKDWLDEAITQAHYKKVFLLELLPTFEKDEVRSTEAEDFPQKITAELKRVYEEAGFEPIVVPVLPLAERTQFVLDRIEEN